MKPGSFPRALLLCSALGLSASCDRGQPAAAAAPSPSPAPVSPAARNGAEERKQRHRERMRSIAEGAARDGARVGRGKFSRQPLGDDGLPPARPFGPLPEDMKTELDALIAQAGGMPAAETALALIDQARDFTSPEVYSLILALLAHPDEAVRGGALSLLEGVRDEGALRVIDKALDDPAADVRLQAVEGMGRITTPETAPVIARAFEDGDSAVRQLAFQSALRQDDATRHVLLESAVKSSHPDLAEAAVGVVEATPSKATVTVMMEALSQADPLVFEKAHDMLYLTFHEDFRDTASAKEWWGKNHRDYDENLVLKNP